ncbi:MAG: bifunctional phosphoribosylaminoimidazolecarboxamide formyltransferase/IMP cyclohydrolase [Flavobacteriales bacterium]|nr:bifunctional phosphoribosylaminoimidazolecarboxamide formyltransferase/IMP cyclohydrolase [Flavobacteriales bacterium]
MRQQKATTLRTVKTALISVFYKDGIDALANYLHQNGVTILSTGGTQSYLENLGIPVVPVEDKTGFPSILGGRVKTLHPAVFGGILNRAENENDQKELQEYHIENIDLVWVDLYPFEETVKNTSNQSEIIEKIDIGGVSLIRAAAKNFNDKIIICNKNQPSKVLSHLQENNCGSRIAFRKNLAFEAFSTTAIYDRHISNYFGELNSTPLRYGENPHQEAHFVGNIESVFKQLHGKELSYNNLLDIDAALLLIGDFKHEKNAVFGILKHNNACGFAVRPTVDEAYAAALEADPVSAFGGILATLSTITESVANAMNDLFFEVLIAPNFEANALEILQQKKNRILLQLSDFKWTEKTVRSAVNGKLIQQRDNKIVEESELKIVTTTPPTNQEIADLLFANKLVKHTKSNAIVLAKNGQLLASGTGQTSRVDALNQAIEKAKNFNFDLHGAVMASDAFFPFPDCVEIANKAGISAVIQPGGSIKDQLSVDYCNQHKMAMVMTGYRHFKH